MFTKKDKKKILFYGLFILKWCIINLHVKKNIFAMYFKEETRNGKKNEDHGW